MPDCHRSYKDLGLAICELYYKLSHNSRGQFTAFQAVDPRTKTLDYSAFTKLLRINNEFRPSPSSSAIQHQQQESSLLQVIKPKCK